MDNPINHQTLSEAVDKWVEDVKGSHQALLHDTMRFIERSGLAEEYNKWLIYQKKLVLTLFPPDERV